MKRLILFLSLVVGVLSTATAAVELEAGKAYVIKFKGNSKYICTPGKIGAFVGYCDDINDAMAILFGYDEEANAYSMFSPTAGAFVGMDSMGFMEASAEPFYWQLLGSNSAMAIRSTVENDYGDSYLVDFGGPSVASTDPQAVWTLEEAPVAEGISLVGVRANNSNCYDLQGRAYVRQPKSGIIIKQGRKVIK